MNMKKNSTLEKFGIVISLIVFLTVMLGVCLHITFVHQMDLATFNWFDNMFEEPKMNFAGGVLNDFMTLVASYGDVATFVLLAIAGTIVLVVKRYYLLGLWLLGTVGVGGLLGVVLKIIFHRSRPYDHLLVDTGFSFPSGHSLSSTLIAMILLTVFVPKVKNLAIRYSAMILIAGLWVSILFSRMYFHAHFLTDVLGGVSLGIVWVLTMKLLGNMATPYLQQVKWFKKNRIYQLN